MSDYSHIMNEKTQKQKLKDKIEVLEHQLALAREVIKAVIDYQKEYTNPVPDLVYRRTLRNQMFEIAQQTLAKLGDLK
jgi:hypothetical protein